MKKIVMLAAFAGICFAGGNAFACPCHEHAADNSAPAAAEHHCKHHADAAAACDCAKDGKACDCAKDGKACNCGK